MIKEVGVLYVDFDPTQPPGIAVDVPNVVVVYNGAIYISNGPGATNWGAVASSKTAFISVADLTALAAIDPASPGNVRGAIVNTLPATQPFFLNPGSTLTPDGITIIAAIGGGNWERALGSPSPDALAQTSWFIDPVAGSDENTGLTAPTALKTVAELFRRWGPSGTIATPGAVPVIVQLLSDLPASDPINATFQRLGPGQLLVFQADDAAILATGTVTVATPQSPATNTLWSIQAGAFDFTPYVGKRLRVTGGPNDGTTCTILDTTGGGSTALIDQPVILPSPTAFSFGVTPSAISGGDTFQIVQQVTAELDQLTMSYEIDEPAAGISLVVIDNLEIVGNISAPNVPLLLMIGCKVSAFFQINSGMTLFTLGSNFAGQASFAGAASISWHAGSATAPSGSAAVVAFVASVLFDADAVLYGGGFVVEEGFQEIAQLAVFNAAPDFLNTGAGVSIITSDSSVQTFGSIYGPSRLWGQGNAMGVSVPPGGMFDSKVPSAKTITGSGGDIQLATQTVARAWDETTGAYTTSRALSWVNLTAAIGGGGFSGNAHDVATGATIVE